MSIIEGGRVRLRAIERADVSHFHEWVNDPEVTHGLSLYLPLSREEEDRWFDGMAQREADERPFAIDVKEGATWRLIGNCGVFAVDWKARCGELGIMIGDKTVWNKGYGTEAIRLLVGHCFGTLNLHRAQLRVYAKNVRAQKSYLKAGFREEGRLREAVFKHGEYDDVIMMSVLRSDWPPRSKEK